MEKRKGIVKELEQKSVKEEVSKLVESEKIN